MILYFYNERFQEVYFSGLHSDPMNFIRKIIVSYSRLIAAPVCLARRLAATDAYAHAHNKIPKQNERGRTTGIFELAQKNATLREESNAEETFAVFANSGKFAKV